ncbi:MAG: hypothetical protein K9L62_02060 [Vallitaleaceae bacterium]|nr:hypothetical protein [Vallitaleaceae bacterium]
MRHGIHKKGYLYSIKTGKLTVREGYATYSEQAVLKLEDYKRNGTPRYAPIANFYFGESDRWAHKVSCAIDPGTTYHMTVWLEERDDKKASDILIEREKLEIQMLNDEIQKRRYRIEALKVYPE